jgi:hypothetical protein
VNACTLGASFDKRENTSCFPVFAVQSYWQAEESVILAANIPAKSRIMSEALGLPITSKIQVQENNQKQLTV